MNRPSLKQATLLRKEKENQTQNTQRKRFWAEVHDLFLVCRTILELKKKEKPDSVADNNELDDELAPHYLALCEKAYPLVRPFMREAIKQQVGDVVMEQSSPPTDKSKLN